MIKLSELQDDSLVIINGEYYENRVISVDDFKHDIDFYHSCEVFIAEESYTARFNAKKMLMSEIENLYDFMYEDWDDIIRDSITSEQIELLQNVLDSILDSNKDINICYTEGEEVEIDI